MTLPQLPPKRLPRKKSLIWMENRLRRLRSIKEPERSANQIVRIRELERNIVGLVATRKK